MLENIQNSNKQDILVSTSPEGDDSNYFQCIQSLSELQSKVDWWNHLMSKQDSIDDLDPEYDYDVMIDQIEQRTKTIEQMRQLVERAEADCQNVDLSTEQQALINRAKDILEGADQDSQETELAIQQTYQGRQEVLDRIRPFLAGILMLPAAMALSLIEFLTGRPRLQRGH